MMFDIFVDICAGIWNRAYVVVWTAHGGLLGIVW